MTLIMRWGKKAKTVISLKKGLFDIKALKGLKTLAMIFVNI